MSSVYRKQKNYDEARKKIEHALPSRQLLFGEKDQSVVDTTIQFIILDREDTNRGSLEAAQARIDILKENRSLEGKFERYCQAEHLQALILLDQGKVKEACNIL